MPDINRWEKTDAGIRKYIYIRWNTDANIFEYAYLYVCVCVFREK